jgi:hypothetical protein
MSQKTFRDRLVAFLPNSLKLAKNSPSNTFPINSQEKGKKDSRLSQLLVPNRIWRVDMGLDKWRNAVYVAESPPYYNRTELYMLYAQALEDFHLASQLKTAKVEVISEAFAIVDRVTGEIDEDKTHLLRRPWFDQYLNHALDAEFWGHSLVEFMPMGPSDSQLMAQEFTRVVLLPRLNVKPQAGLVVKEPNYIQGVYYREEPWIDNLLEIGDRDDLGLLRIATKEVIIKNNARTDWARAAEKFGMPYLVIKTSTDVESELRKRAEMAANFGANGWAIVDKEDEMTLLEPKGSDAYKVYQEQMTYADDQMSKGTNGQTSTSDQKAFVGSAEVHERVQNTYTKARMRRIQYHVNYELIPFMAKHGYPFDAKNDEFVYLGLMESDDQDGGDNIDTDPTDDPQDDTSKPQPPKKKLAHRGGGMGKRPMGLML